MNEARLLYSLPPLAHAPTSIVSSDSLVQHIKLALVFFLPDIPSYFKNRYY